MSTEESFTEFYKAIGFNILWYRRKKNWTQENLSFESKISRSQISKIEHGIGSFKIETLLMIAKALEVDVKVLMKKSKRNL